MSESTRTRLLHDYDALLLDLDGVVYAGGQPVPHAPQVLAEVRGEGTPLAFVTNNASRTPEVVADLLTSLGVSAHAGEVATAAQAAARLLAAELAPGAAVLVVGGEGLRQAVADIGLEPVAEARPEVAAVVQGYSPDVGWRDLAEAVVAIRSGARWVATNLDRTIPSERGLLPGNGALVAAVATATERQPDAVAGKPEPPLHREAVLRTGGVHPLVVGDRLDTDIEGAHRVDVDSLLVLTGVTSPAQLCRALPHQRPTYVGADLRALVQPVPGAPGSHVTRNDTRLRVIAGERSATSRDVSDGWLDALRAALPLAWAIVDDGGEPDVELSGVPVSWWQTGTQSG